MYIFNYFYLTKQYVNNLTNKMNQRNSSKQNFKNKLEETIKKYQYQQTSLKQNQTYQKYKIKQQVLEKIKNNHKLKNKVQYYTQTDYIDSKESYAQYQKQSSVDIEQNEQSIPSEISQNNIYEKYVQTQQYIKPRNLVISTKQVYQKIQKAYYQQQKYPQQTLNLKHKFQVSNNPTKINPNINVVLQFHQCLQHCNNEHKKSIYQNQQMQTQQEIMILQDYEVLGHKNKYVTPNRYQQNFQKYRNNRQHTTNVKTPIKNNKIPNNNNKSSSNKFKPNGSSSTPNKIKISSPQKKQRTYQSFQSNQKTIVDIIKNIFFKSSLYEKQRQTILQTIENSSLNTYIFLLKQPKKAMKAIYSYDYESQSLKKVYGDKSPEKLLIKNIIEFYKYNTATKSFEILVGINNITKDVIAITTYINNQ